MHRIRSLVVGVVTGVASVLACSSVALADVSVTVMDNYYGGLDTYNNPGDSIGGGIFNIDSATFTRSSDGKTLTAVINTAFAGFANTDAGVGYGSLFITRGLGAWNPTPGGTNFSNDTYTTGEWKYALSMPTKPGTGNQSGVGSLYATGNGALNTLTPGFGTIVSSNVNGNPVTAPFSGNPGFYFREDQAVQFNPAASIANPLGISDTWNVNQSAHTITFTVVDNGLLGNDFAFAWAMTCANDVIQGQVHLPVLSNTAPVPEASTWAMMIIGFMGIGFAAYRRKNLSLRLI